MDGSDVVAALGRLAAGEHSGWHRLDADEIWQYSAGDPLELRVWAAGDAEVTTHRLAGDLADASVVQAIVPPGACLASGSGRSRAPTDGCSSIRSMRPSRPARSRRLAGSWRAGTA